MTHQIVFGPNFQIQRKTMSIGNKIIVRIRLAEVTMLMLQVYLSMCDLLVDTIY